MSFGTALRLAAALVLLLSMPVALVSFVNMWRSRIEQPLSPAAPTASVAQTEPQAVPAPPAAPAPRPVDELLDLDRDGAWDEVWSIRTDEIVRDVSPQDDGQMRERWSWVNGAWVSASAAGAP